MGSGSRAAAPGRLKILVLLVPIALCLAILWQTSQLYGSCKAPTHVQDLESLKTYLLETAQQFAKRNREAAAAMQQLAAELGESGPRVQAATADLEATQGYLETCKQKTLEHMVEITELKSKAGAIKQHEDAAKAAKQEVRRLQQQLKEKEEQLQKKDEELKTQQQQQQQQQEKGSAQTQTAAAPVLPGETAGRLHVLNTAGLQCHAVKDQEFWADPLVWGYDHRAQDAAECCAACHAYNAAAERGGLKAGRNSTRCNTWAFCADKEACKGRLGECWLKHQKQPLPPPPALPPDAHAVKGWLSGVVYPEEVLLGQKADKVPNLVMHTTLGDIDIQLLPELGPGSVRELQRMALLQADGVSKCSNCRIYRPEPNFLVQGILEAPGSYVEVPRHPSPQQPLVMPRGMVCWAGGGGGSHFFVNLVDQSGFKDEHLCWGQVSDMALLDKIVTLPKKDKKPGAMNELVEHIRFTISLKAQ